MVDSPKADMLRSMNTRLVIFLNTGCDEAAIHKTPEGFHREIKELELVHFKDKKKGSDAVYYSHNGLPLTSCMKRNIGSDVPPDVIQAIADIRPFLSSREGYRGKLCLSISGVSTW